MTTLLIDAGNTRIKFGWIDTRTGEREPVALALGHAELEQIEPWLATRPNDAASGAIRAIGTNVAGNEAGSRIEDLVRRHLGTSVSWVTGTPVAAGVRNGYMNPAQLGPDRWVSMVGLAGHAQGRGPMMLASFGTTTTIDTLGYEAGEPVFVGGLILPGPMLMRASLASATANLPLAESSFAAFGLHTHQAISSGIAAAQTGALLRQWREGIERFGQAPRVFCSGGGWPLVESEVCRTLLRAQADLGQAHEPVEWLATPVLDGLARLALL
jgi:type III pantothenate kinase